MGRSASPPTSQARAILRSLLTIVAALLLLGGWGALTYAHASTHRMASGSNQIQPPADEPASPELEQVLKGLMCRCGCNLTVYACERTMTCEVAGRMRNWAEKRLDAGMTVSQALDAFAADYGEQVLAAPTKRGFNLTAWVLPFVALGIGGLVVAYALRSWRPRRSEPEQEVPAADPKYVAAVEEEVLREV